VPEPQAAPLRFETAFSTNAIALVLLTLDLATHPDLKDNEA
jgi:hypothetical protein